MNFSFSSSSSGGGSSSGSGSSSNSSSSDQSSLLSSSCSFQDRWSALNVELSDLCSVSDTDAAINHLLKESSSLLQQAVRNDNDDLLLQDDENFDIILNYLNTNESISKKSSSSSLNFYAFIDKILFQSLLSKVTKVDKDMVLYKALENIVAIKENIVKVKNKKGKNINSSSTQSLNPSEIIQSKHFQSYLNLVSDDSIFRNKLILLKFLLTLIEDDMSRSDLTKNSILNTEILLNSDCAKRLTKNNILPKSSIESILKNEKEISRLQSFESKPRIVLISGKPTKIRNLEIQGNGVGFIGGAQIYSKSNIYFEVTVKGEIRSDIRIGWARVDMVPKNDSLPGDYEDSWTFDPILACFFHDSNLKKDAKDETIKSDDVNISLKTNENIGDDPRLQQFIEMVKGGLDVNAIIWMMRREGLESAEINTFLHSIPTNDEVGTSFNLIIQGKKMNKNGIPLENCYDIDKSARLKQDSIIGCSLCTETGETTLYINGLRITINPEKYNEKLSIARERLKLALESCGVHPIVSCIHGVGLEVNLGQLPFKYPLDNHIGILTDANNEGLDAARSAISPYLHFPLTQKIIDMPSITIDKLPNIGLSGFTIEIGVRIHDKEISMADVESEPTGAVIPSVSIQIYDKSSDSIIDCSLVLCDDGTLLFETDGKTLCQTPPFSLDKNSWRHVALSYSSTKGLETVFFFIDGVLIYKFELKDSLKINPLVTSIKTISIKEKIISKDYKSSASGEFSEGYPWDICELRIWANQRTEENIKATLGRLKISGIENNLLCCLLFMEGGGNIIYNSTLLQDNLVPERIVLESGIFQWDVLNNAIATNYNPLMNVEDIGPITNTLVDNFTSYFQLDLWSSVNIVNEKASIANEIQFRGLGDIFSQILLGISLNIENYCESSSKNSRMRQVQQSRYVDSIVNPHVLNFVLIQSILRQVIRCLNASATDEILSLLLGLSIIVLKLLNMNLKIVMEGGLSPASVGLQYSALLESCHKSFVAKLLVAICNFISLPTLSRRRGENLKLNQMIQVVHSLAVDVVTTGFDIFLPHATDRIILLQCLLYRKRLNNLSFNKDIIFPSEVLGLLEKSNPSLSPESVIDPLGALLSLSLDGEALLRNSLFKMFSNISNATKIIPPTMLPTVFNESLEDYVKVSSNVNSNGEYIQPQIGEIVERGPDWKYGDQDGGTKGSSSKGIIINISSWCGCSNGSCISVLWPSNGSINSYRWGVSEPLVSISPLYDLKIYRKSTHKEMESTKDLNERKALKYTPDEVLQSLVSQVGELSKRTVLSYMIENSTQEWQEKNNLKRSINTLVSKLSPDDISKLYSNFYSTFGFKKSHYEPFLSLYSDPTIGKKPEICLCENLKQLMVLLARDISLSIQESNVSGKGDERNDQSPNVPLLFTLQGILTGTITANPNLRQNSFVDCPKDKIVRKPFIGSDNKLRKWIWNEGTWSSFISYESTGNSNDQETSRNNIDSDIKILHDLTFDSNFLSDNLILNDDCKNVEQSGHNQWSTAVGSIPMHPNTGVYRWYSRVESFGGKRGNCIFGIASEDCCCESFLGYSEDGWGLTTNQELFHEGNKIKSDFGPKLSLGAIVEITLDTNTGTLTYSLPQSLSQPEVAFTCLDEITYYPAWSLYATGDSISILSGVDDKIGFSNQKLRELKKNDQIVEVPGLSGVPTYWIIEYCLELLQSACELLDDCANVEHELISCCLTQLMSTLSRWQCINPYGVKKLITELNKLMQKISVALSTIPFSSSKSELDNEGNVNHRENLNQLSCVTSTFLGILTSFWINGGKEAQISNLLIAMEELDEVHDPVVPSTATNNSSQRDWLSTKIFSQGFRSTKDTRTDLVDEFLSLQSNRFSMLVDWLTLHDITHINFRRLGGDNLNIVVRILFGAIIYHSGYFRALSTLATKLLEEVNYQKSTIENVKPPAILLKAWEYAIKFRLDSKEIVVREGTTYDAVARKSTGKLKFLLKLEQHRHEIDCPGTTLSNCIGNWEPRYQSHIYQILSENSSFCRTFALDKVSVSFLRAKLLTAENRASIRKDGLKALRMCISNVTDEFGWGVKCAMLRFYPTALKLNTSCTFHSTSKNLVKTIPKVSHYLSGLNGCSKSEKLDLKGAFDSLFSCLTEELVRSSTGSHTSLQLNIIACLGTQIIEDDHVMLSRVGIFNVLQELLDAALTSSSASTSNDKVDEESGQTFKNTIKATMKLFILLALQVASSGESEAYHTLSLSRDNSIRENSVRDNSLKTSKSGPATLSSAVFKILYTLLSTVMNTMVKNLQTSDLIGAKSNIMVSVISHDAYVIIDETTILLSFISKELSCQQLLKNPIWLRLLLDLIILSPSSCQPRAMMILSYLLPSMDPKEIETSNFDFLSIVDKYNTRTFPSSASGCEIIIRIILNQCCRSMIENEVEFLVTTSNSFSRADYVSVIVPLCSEAVGLIRSLLQSRFSVWSTLVEKIILTTFDCIDNCAINDSNVSELLASFSVLGGHIDYLYPQGAVIIDNGAGVFEFGIVCNVKPDVVEVVKQVKNNDNNDEIADMVTSHEKIILPLDKVKPINRLPVGDLRLSDTILKKLFSTIHIMFSNEIHIAVKVIETDKAMNDSNKIDDQQPNENDASPQENNKYDSLKILKATAIRSLSSLLESRTVSKTLAQITKTIGDAIVPEFAYNMLTLANSDSKSNGISDIPIQEEHFILLNVQRQKLAINQVLKLLAPADQEEVKKSIEKPKKTESSDSYLRMHMEDSQESKGRSPKDSGSHSSSTQFPSQRVESSNEQERAVDSATVDLLENMGFPRRWCEIALQLCGDDFGEAVNYILSNGDTLEQIANEVVEHGNMSRENVLSNYFNDHDDGDMEPDGEDDCDDQDSESFLMRFHQNINSYFSIDSPASIENPKEFHYISTAQRFLPLFVEPDANSERIGAIFPGDDINAYAEVKSKTDGSSWLKVKLADHDDECEFLSDELNDSFHSMFVYCPRSLGNVEVVKEGSNSMIHDVSQNQEYPTDIVPLKAVYKIVGLNGAMVRSGIETESSEVILLSPNEIVHACEEGYNSEGKLRLRITQPVVGWITKLFGLVQKMFEESVNPDNKIKHETKQDGPILSDIELLNQLEDDMEQWIGGDIFRKEDRYFGSLQGMHYHRSKDLNKRKLNHYNNRRSRIMGSSSRHNPLNDLSLPSTYLDDLISSKSKTLTILHARKLVTTLFLNIFGSTSYNNNDDKFLPLIPLLNDIVDLKMKKDKSATMNEESSLKVVCGDVVKFLRSVLYRGDPYSYLDDLSMTFNGSDNLEISCFYTIEILLQNSSMSMRQELTAVMIAAVAQNVRIACSTSYSETSWYDSIYEDETDEECLTYGNIHFALWATRMLVRLRSSDITLSIFTIWNLSMRASSMSLKQIAFTMCGEILNLISSSYQEDSNLLKACLLQIPLERLEFMCSKRLWYEMEDDPFYSRFLQALINLLATVKSAQVVSKENLNNSSVVDNYDELHESIRSVINFDSDKSHIILSPQSDIQGSWTAEFWIYCHDNSISKGSDKRDNIGDVEIVERNIENSSNIITSSYLLFSSNGYIKLRAGGRVFKENEVDDPDASSMPVCENALCIACGTSRNSTEKSFDFIVPSNQWVHLALSSKGSSSSSSSTINLIVNGQLQDSISMKFPLPISHIGCPRVGQTFNGNLAEMRVWSHARSAAEITRDMNVNVSGAKGLLLHLQCLEGLGSRIYDSAGFVNVCKLSGCSWVNKSAPNIKQNSNPAFMLTSSEENEGIYGECIGDSAGVIEMTGTITRIGKPGVPQGETTDNSTEVICLCYRMKDFTGDIVTKKSGEIEGYLDWCDRHVRSRISGIISDTGNLEFFIIESSTILGPPESMEWLQNLAFSGYFHEGELSGSISIQYYVQSPCLKQGEVRLDLFSIPKEVEYKKSDSKEKISEILAVKDGQEEGQYVITVEAFPSKKFKQSDSNSEEFKEEKVDRPIKDTINTYGLCSGQGSTWIQWYIEKSNGAISFGALTEESLLSPDSCVFVNPDVWCYNVQGSASHSTDILVAPPVYVGDIISVRLDTDNGVLEFYRNDTFIHHFDNLHEHPAFLNLEESNSNGVRLFCCLTSYGETVKYLGPKEGICNIKYTETSYMNRSYIKCNISDGNFNGIGEFKYQDVNGFYYGECVNGKQNGIQLLVTIDNNTETISNAFLYEDGICLRELTETEKDENAEDVNNSIKSSYNKMKAAFTTSRTASQSDSKVVDDSSELGQLKRALSRGSRSPRSEHQSLSVTFRLRDRTGSELHFKVSIQVKIQKVFDVYASKKNIDVKSLQFTLDGEKITGDQTPEMLDIQENDTIEVSCSGDPVLIENLLKKSTAPYILQIILSNGATVRNGIEIEDSASVRMLQCGEVIEAYNRSKTKEGITRYRIADGWISEKLRGGNEDQVVSVLRVLPPKPLHYTVVREGGAKVRISHKLNSEEIGFIPFNTIIEIAEKRLVSSEEEPRVEESTMRLRVVAPEQWAGWISDKSHIIKAMDDDQEDPLIDPDLLNELSRRAAVRQRKSSLVKSKTQTIRRLVSIKGSLRVSSNTFFLIGGSQKKPGLIVTSDFASVICETSVHGRVMALGSRGFSRGIHYWEVGVDSAQWGSVFIGVAPFEASNSWGGYGLLNYRATQAFGNETLYGSYFGANDTVGVLLDMDHGTLTFLKDGQFCSENIVINMGVAYHNLRRNNRVSSTELFPCFGMKATNDKLTIKNCHWISNRGLGCNTKLYQILQSKRFLSQWRLAYNSSKMLSHLMNIHESYIRQCSDNKTIIKSRPGIEVMIDTKDSALLPFGLTISSATKIKKSRYGKGKVLGIRKILDSVQIWYKIDSDSCGAWYWTKEDITSMMETGEIDFDTDVIKEEDNNNNKVNEEKSKVFFTLEDFTTFMTNTAWTLEEDVKIVSLVNKLANKLNIDPLRITSKQLEDSRNVYQILPHRSAAELHARYAAICVLNKAASIALPFLDFGISSNHIPLIRSDMDNGEKKSQIPIQTHFASSGQEFVDIKSVIFTRTKMGLWNLAVKESTINTAPHPDEFERPEDLREIVINRIEARHASQNKDLITLPKCLSLSVFGQLMNGMRSWDDRSFRRGFVHKEDDGQARAFFVKFVGEGVDDHGGPYRAVFQTAIGEEASTLIGLLTPSANSKAELGEYRDKFVFDPVMSSNPEGLPLFCHFGKLLGVACRHSIHVNLSLPQLIWKPLVGEALDLNDLDAVDRAVIQSLDSILNRNVPEDSICDLLTQALLNDSYPSGSYLPDLQLLLRDVNSVSKVHISEDKIAMICALIKSRRLTSHLFALQQFYRGLSVSLPTELFSIFTSNELENLFCGASEIDINVLKKATVYDGVNPTDRHIQMFWSIIEKMSQDELSKLINFCSGRSRLPDAAADFTMKFKLIAPPPSSQQKPDEYLPIAQTCFFSLSIPEYSSEEIASAKLKYAISNTELMDADFVMHNAHGWENVNNQH